MEVKRCVSMGFHGFEIGSHIGEKSLDHKDFHPLYKICEMLGAVIFVHPWDMDSWGGRLNKFWMSWLVGMPAETAQAICSVLMGNILKLFPRLKLCFAHGGGAYPAIRGRVSHGHHVRPDLCALECEQSPKELDGLLWMDSLVHDPAALRLLIDTVGKDQIVLGTDYPFPLGELAVGQVVEQYEDFNEKDKDNLLWGNCVKMMGYDECTLFSRKL